MKFEKAIREPDARKVSQYVQIEFAEAWLDMKLVLKELERR